MMSRQEERCRNWQPWNGPPEFKPDDWPERPYPWIPLWNGPPELKPDNWGTRKHTP